MLLESEVKSGQVLSCASTVSTWRIMRQPYWCWLYLVSNEGIQFSHEEKGEEMGTQLEEKQLQNFRAKISACLVAKDVVCHKLIMNSLIRMRSN